MTTTTGKSSKRKTATPSGRTAKAAPATAAKTTAGKAAKKPAAAEITPEQRHQLIAEAAYLRAESRSFDAGDPIDDWLQAEQEIDARLTGGQGAALH